MIERMRSSNHYYIVLNYCNGGDLQSYLEKVRRVSEVTVRKMANQMIYGMDHLNSVKAIHRDLKLSNIFIHFPEMVGKEDMITKEWLKNVNLEEVEFQVKIGDLGFAKLQESIIDLSTTYCGTPINMAPEMLNRDTYNYKTDVWSLGTVIFELLTGYSPFKNSKNKEQLKEQIRENRIYFSEEINLSKECLRFINTCLRYNPADRPSWKDLLRHNFIMSYK